MLHRGSSCLLVRAMDGRIMCHGIISSCQSAATSQIVKRFWTRHESDSCKERYSKYLDLYLYLKKAHTDNTVISFTITKQKKS